jgi:PKD repeat protein
MKMKLFNKEFTTLAIMMFLFIVVFNGCVDNENESLIAKISYDKGTYFPSSEILFYIYYNNEGAIVNNTIDWGDGNVEYFHSIIYEVVHQYNNSGLYKITLTVTNDIGVADSYSIKIKINDPPNQSPIVRMYEPNPYSGDAPLEVSFASDSIDKDGSIVKWEWDFGDGHNITFSNEIEGNNPMYIFNVPGEYFVKVIITDNDGATDTDWCYIMVN